jgi:phage shock protein PspC (stress-responsive transcriptional regulator)
LLRSADDRVLGGVCAGLARSLGIDPLIVRIAFVALTFIGGISLLAYLAALALVPADDGTGHPARERPSGIATVLGAVLIVLAVVSLTGGWGWGGLWAGGGTAVIAGLVLAGYAGYVVAVRRGSDQPTALRILGAGVLLIAGCAAALATLVGSAWATAVGGGEVIAGLVIVLGVVMIGLGVSRRRARWLALPALLLALPAAAVSAAGIDVRGGMGERSSTPATVADLGARQRLGVGELRLDLRRMQWPTIVPVSLKVKLGTGHTVVYVPRDVCVQLHAKAGAGYVEVLGESAQGVDIDEHNGTVARSIGKRLILDVDLGIGAVEVRHTRVDHDRRFGPRDETSERITPAMARAGCAGRAA